MSTHPTLHWSSRKKTYILGVYQKSGIHMIVYYQETTGPKNYHSPDELNVDPPAPYTLTLAILVSSQYDYPLVTVEIGKHAE